jgi:hypothetical protein
MALLEQYYEICCWDLHRRRAIAVSTDVKVNLGGVFACSSGDQLQIWMEVASLPDVEVDYSHWHRPGGEVMADGWIRYFILSTWKAICSNHVHSSFSSSNVLKLSRHTCGTTLLRCLGSVKQITFQPPANHIQFRELSYILNPSLVSLS